MAMPLVETKNLKKYFKTGAGMLHAVEDVNLKIMPGKTLGVVGESGCGKSTLGRTILRLQPATAGEVLYNGENILKYKGKDMQKIHLNMQMVFQDPYSSLDPRMSVHNLIAEPVQVCGLLKTKAEINEHVREIMDMCGLPADQANLFPHELDGGLRQRVGLARAMAVSPKFIVCDEPVSALDVSIQAQVINMFEELQDKLGLTYLFIAHDLLVVRHISDRIAVMYLGKMVELADAEEIYNHPLHPYSQSLLSAVPLPDPKMARANKRIVLTGDIPSPLNAPSGCPFRTRCRYATEACAQSMPPFEEVEKGHFVACHRVKEIN